MKFIKMNGLGNDYVFIDCRNEEVSDPCMLARKVSDRHKGIGSDGLVLMFPDQECDLGMRIFNADGSEAETCGNACRCIARYAWESGWCRKPEIRLMTAAGLTVLKPEIDHEKFCSASVDMGQVRDIQGPMKVNAYESAFTGFYVNIGNPHFVILGNPVSDALLLKYGPLIENSDQLAMTVNVEFATLISEDRLKVRVWERGSGITRACGSGACAVFAAARQKGLCGDSAEIELDGGTLNISFEEKTGHIIQSGPAEVNFYGEL